MVATVVTATRAAAAAKEVVEVAAEDMVAAVTITVVTITSNSNSSPQPQVHLPARPVRLVPVPAPPAWLITPPNTLSTTDKVLTPTLLMVGTRTMWHTTSITSKPLLLSSNSNSSRTPLPRLLHQLAKLLLPLPPDPGLLPLLPVEVATVRYETPKM